MRLHATLASPDETATLGQALGAVLMPGDVVALEGELGAGKTTIVRSIVEGLGGKANHVSSPTFTIAQEYTAGAHAVVHIDAYRLDPDSDELGPMGYDRLDDGESVVLIEWPGKLAGRVEFSATVTLTHAGETTREITLELPEDWQTRTGMLALEALCEPPRVDTVCPATGERVAADSPTWPFVNERARMADLHGWLSEKYTVTRPIEQRDIEQE